MGAASRPASTAAKAKDLDGLRRQLSAMRGSKPDWDARMRAARALVERILQRTKASR